MVEVGRETLEAIRRRLEWEVTSGRRHVIDAELAASVAGGNGSIAASTAAPLVPEAPRSVSAPRPAAAPPPDAASRPAASPRAEAGGRAAQSAAQRAAGLAELGSKTLSCTRCPLARGRTHVVFGAGNPDADLMFVGEAPGRDEDLEGQPFVGRAGQLLTRIIEAIKLERQDVYIANVLKCRPPENRNPSSTEIALCSPFLYEQIEWVAPQVIRALGRFAAMTLLKSSAALGSMRGRVHRFQGIPVVVTYHPAALLRYEKLKRPTWADMQAVQRILAGETPPNWAK